MGKVNFSGFFFSFGLEIWVKTWNQSSGLFRTHRLTAAREENSLVLSCTCCHYKTTLDLHAGVLTKRKLAPMPYLCSNTVTQRKLPDAWQDTQRQSQALPVRSPGLSSPLLLHYYSVCLMGTERELEGFRTRAAELSPALFLPSLSLWLLLLVLHVTLASATIGHWNVSPPPPEGNVTMILL